MSKRKNVKKTKYTIKTLITVTALQAIIGIVMARVPDAVLDHISVLDMEFVFAIQDINGYHQIIMVAVYFVVLSNGLIVHKRNVNVILVMLDAMVNV